MVKKPSQYCAPGAGSEYLGHFSKAENMDRGHNNVLMAAERNALKSSQFALPGRHYPINDKAHARNALARASQYATPAEQKRIAAKVAKKFPGIHQGK